MQNSISLIGNQTIAFIYTGASSVVIRPAIDEKL